MESQVEEIKKKLDIVEVISKYLPLKKRGRHFLCNCPFHSEKTPSFTVSQELQIFKCFGCGKAGDIFTFLQEYDHIGFRDALEDLAKMAGIVLKKDPQFSALEHRQARLIDLNRETAKFYNYILTSHPLGKSALLYLHERQITPDSIKLFKIGYSPSNPVLLVNYLQKKGFAREDLIASGTFTPSRYRQSGLFDRFQERLIFPLSDFRDRILGFSGRLLPSSTSSNQGKYINSPETDIYHKSHQLYGLNLAKDSIKKQNSVIVVEGEFDMISPFQIGVTNIVAIKGTAFTADQLQLLRRYTDNLILGLDSDFAGNNAAKKSIEMADSMDFDIQVLTLGDKYKDPDEAVTADPTFFKDQLQHTVPIWDFILQSALKSNDPSTIKGKKSILSLVLPFLVKINNTVIRTDYFHRLANQLGSDFDSVMEESKKIDLKKSLPTSIIPVRSTSTIISSKVDLLEEYLLTLVFSAKKPALLSRQLDKKIEFTLPRFQKIFFNLTQLKKVFKAASFANSLPLELRSVFENLYLGATLLQIDSHRRLVEINKTVNQILGLRLKEKLTNLSQQINQAESSSNNQLLETLENEYNQTLQQLSRIQSSKARFIG